MNGNFHGEQTHLTPKRARALGWIMVACGVFLTALISYLLVIITRIMRHSKDLGATSYFTGDATDAAMIFGILGLVLVFGVACVFAGVDQIRTGRRNPKTIRLVLIIGGILYLTAIIVQFME